MNQSKKIDESLKERHGIVSLLKRLDNENITVGEMEEIGAKLQRSGKRALSPLVRGLWRENNGELLSKYAYLLDFFEDDIWLDQLIQITLKRRDLDAEGKSALLSALENYGIDITCPPFSKMLEDVSGSLGESLPRLLDRGEQGLSFFTEDFTGYTADVQIGIIRELAKVDDDRVLRLLEIVLFMYDRDDLAFEALTTLGYIRKPEAADLLNDFLRFEKDERLATAARRSLRRLTFLGIDTAPRTRPLYPFHIAFVSPIDGTGNRTAWISRWCGQHELDALYLQIHETRGLLDALSYSRLQEEEFDRLVGEVREEERLIEVPVRYALALMNDALNLNTEHMVPCPPDLYVRGPMMKDNRIVPGPYIPDFPGCRLAELPLSEELFCESDTLLDHDFCAGWILADPMVFDIAEEWRSIDGSDEKNFRRKEALVEKLCRELLKPQLEKLSRRLLLTADLMQKTGEDHVEVEKAVATALTVAGINVGCHAHPFIRRLAVESLEMAVDALSEGYDLRLHAEIDYEDW